MANYRLYNTTAHFPANAFVDAQSLYKGALELSLTVKLLAAREGDTNEFFLDFDGDPIAADDTTLTAFVAAFSGLLSLKALRYFEIDEKTTAILNAGVDHLGDMYSLSVEAQVSIAQGYQQRNDANYFDDPFVVNSIDDTAQIVITNAAGLATLFDDVATKVRAVRKGGTDLKDSIRTAVDKAAVDAIVDSR